jgi:hypothetical protein
VKQLAGYGGTTAIPLNARYRLAPLNHTVGAIELNSPSIMAVRANAESALLRDDGDEFKLTSY